MGERTNEHGLPVGRALPGWEAPLPVAPVTLVGRTCRVEPAGPQHSEQLHRSLNLESDPALWSYYAAGPHRDAAALADWIARLDALPHAIVVTGEETARGIAAYMRNDARNGSVEVGNIVLGDALQRTTAATEAMYLMMRHVFDDLGYRRYEWKCDSLNAPSRRAAQRYGFTYEGIFRNAVVYRERNRDTAWYSVIDADWPQLRAEFERWLAPSNFDAAGVQLTRLGGDRGACVQ